MKQLSKQEASVRLKKTCYLLSVSREEQHKKQSGRHPSFSLTPFLPVYLTGTKYSCGGGGCGACTVMVSRYDPKTKKIQYPLCWAKPCPRCTWEGPESPTFPAHRHPPLFFPAVYHTHTTSRPARPATS